MTPTSSRLDIDGVPVELIRKDIKHLYLRVFPPDGRVQITAPWHYRETDIRLAFSNRRLWIERQCAKVQAAAIQAQRQLEPGAVHHVWGQPKLLDLPRHGRPRVAVSDWVLSLTAPEHYTDHQRLAVLKDFYYLELKVALSPLLRQWQPVVGRQASRVRVRWMKTRWGSCQPKTGSLTFNLELAKRDPRCLEYVVVHELTHLIERAHNQRFWGLMDQFLPDWRVRRAELKTGQPVYPPPDGVPASD